MLSRLTFIFIIICLIVIGVWFLIQPEDSLEINNMVFAVEVVDTDEQIKKGLSGRSELAENQGMLFIFNQSGFYPFWMKEMLFPIDIIWLNNNKEVVFIKKDAQPCLEENCQIIEPDKKARYVLEVKAGIADKINIKIGDKLIFDR